MPEKQRNALCFKKGRLLLCQKSKAHALRSLIHNYFDSQRNKVIEAKQKLHDLLTDKMLFLVKRGDYFYARKAKRMLFALKRGDYFYARKAKHTLYGV